MFRNPVSPCCGLLNVTVWQRLPGPGLLGRQGVLWALKASGFGLGETKMSLDIVRCTVLMCGQEILTFDVNRAVPLSCFFRRSQRIIDTTRCSLFMEGEVQEFGV